MRHRGVFLSAQVVGVSAVAIGLGCSTSPPQPGPTSELAVTGVAVVSGTVSNALLVPLDSFRVGGGIIEADQHALYYPGRDTVTGRDGRFTVRFERVGAGPPFVAESILVGIGAHALRAGELGPDGALRTALVRFWLKFERPPRPPYTKSVNIAVP